MNKIFVFGSNLAGRHGAGAALFARNHKGAKYGVGEGFMGQCYALPTKDRSIKTLPIHRIELHVMKFLEFAKNNPDLIFEVTRVGCGLAGYKDEDIAPLFTGAPSNCELPNGWRELSRWKEK
ncbi:MAG TPA: hypothetical protein V6C58_18750 [Allocoleopsis sp.]